MNEDLVSALNLLKRGREILLESYIERNSDRYRYSFQYHNRPSSLDIAANLIDHQWLDYQLAEAKEKCELNKVSMASLKLFFEKVQRFSIFRGNIDLFDGYKSLVVTKIKALESLLDSSNNMTEKLKMIEFDYYRDKVLFEREMEKYTNEIEVMKN